MLRKLAVVLAIISLLVPAGVGALGLGTIEMNSALNQPLQARIPLLRVRPGELEKLEVKLASAEVFMQAGIDRPAYLSDLKFEIVAPRERRPYVLVSSRKPITEPYLNILVEVVWEHGRLLREFTVLVDPPVLTDSTGGGIQPPQSFEQDLIETQEIIDQDAGSIRSAGAPPPTLVQRPGEPTETQVIREEPAPEPVRPSQSEMETRTATTTTTIVEPDMPAIPDGPRPSAVQGTSQSLTSGGFEYHTKRGDTLWEIAKAMRGNNTDVTIEQLMIAMLRANPDSFYRNNINNLKQGFVLRIDDFDQVRSIGKKEASRLARVQWEQWKSHRSTMVGSASSSTRTSGSGGSAKPKVRLVSPGEGEESESGAPATVGKDGGAPSEVLSLLNEQLDASSRENEELKSRLEERETQLDKLERLVELQNDQLSDLEKQLGTEVKKPTVDDVPAKTPAQDPAQAQAQAQAQKPAPAAPATKPAPAAKPAPAPAPRPAPAPAADKDLVSTVMDTLKGVLDTVMGAAGPVIKMAKDNPIYAAGGGGGLLLLILIVWGLKRRRSMSSFQESILTGKSSLGDDSDFSSAESGSFMSDFAVSTMEGIEADVDDVDPLSEADVYLVYNQFDQARAMLAEHMDSGNDKPELKQKMLEVLQAGASGHEMDDQKGEYRQEFEAKASEYKSSLSGAQWAEVCAWATGLGCDNPIFSGAHEGPAAAAAADTGMDMTMDMGGDDGGAALDEGLDFDLDSFDTGLEGDEEGAEAALDFDLDSAGDAEAPVEQAAPADSDMDFDMDMDMGGEEAALDMGGDEGGLDFNLEDDGESDGAMDLGLDMEAGAEDAGGMDFSLDMDEGDEGGADEGGLDFSMDDLSGDLADNADGGFEEETISFDIKDVGPAADDSMNIESNEMDGGIDFDSGGGEDDGMSLDFDTGGGEEEGASLDFGTGGGEDDGMSLDFNTGGGEEEGASLDFGTGDSEDDGMSLDFDTGGGDEEGGLSMDFDTGGGDEEGGLSMDFDTGGGDEEGGLSMDFDTGGGDEGDLSMDFDTGGDDGGLSMDLDADDGLSMGLDEDQEESLDFNLGAGDEVVADDDLDFGLSADDGMTADAGEEASDLGMDTDFDSEIDESLFADVDEVGTKLDLAKAYIDMGDADGARSILDEVVEEGNETQKQEAQELIQQMG